MLTNWQKEERQKVKENEKLAKELAPLLGGTPRKVASNGFDIDLGNGMSIGIVTNDKTKYQVHRDWPCVEHCYYAPDDRTHINVTKSRGVQALANEITKRLLPGYAEEFQKQLDRGNATVKHTQDMRALTTELCLLAGGGTPSESELQGYVLHTYKHNLYQIQISELDSVRIETSSMPVEVAKQIIALMRKLNPK